MKFLLGLIQPSNIAIESKTEGVVQYYGIGVNTAVALYRKGYLLQYCGDPL